MAMVNVSIQDTVARAVLAAYSALPQKSKPKPRPHGTGTEWVPLSGIALENDGEVVCAALGTGMKCLPHSKIPQAKGLVIHDSHAEVIAIRAFNCFLLEECRRLSISDSSYASRYVRRRENGSEVSAESPQRYMVREGVRIYFYSSEAPCGDGSMELTINSQPNPTPWLPPPPASSSTSTPTSLLLRGRGYFSNLGSLRTKPGRADSPPTLSKSCSDKLTLRQFISLLLSPVSLILAPGNVYIDTFVLPEEEYSHVGFERAFSKQGRVAELCGRAWREGYAFRPFSVRTTRVEFPYSRRAAVAAVAGRGGLAIPSNITAAWTANGELQGEGGGGETIINGVRQGRRQFPAGISGASNLCKAKVWKQVLEIGGLIGDDLGLGAQRGVETDEVEKKGYRYKAMKNSARMSVRNTVKTDVRNVLSGLSSSSSWVRNGGDEFENI